MKSKKLIVGLSLLTCGVVGAVVPVTVKSLKATNLKLEDKLQTSINEINKGNDIIEKLQTEIKNQKSKNKGTKQALQSQEQLTTQKQILLDEQIRNLNDLKVDKTNKHLV